MLNIYVKCHFTPKLSSEETERLIVLSRPHSDQQLQNIHYAEIGTMHYRQKHILKN